MSGPPRFHIRSLPIRSCTERAAVSFSLLHPSFQASFHFLQDIFSGQFSVSSGHWTAVCRRRLPCTLHRCHSHFLIPSLILPSHSPAGAKTCFYLGLQKQRLLFSNCSLHVVWWPQSPISLQLATVFRKLVELKDFVEPHSVWKG